MVQLKYLSSFWRTPEIHLINSEINFDQNWSIVCVKLATAVAHQGTTFSITYAKVYVPVVTLSTRDSANLLEQLKSAFKRTINWNKYQLKKSIQNQNQYLNYLIDPIFQGVDRLFVISFEDETQRTNYKRYHVLTKIKIYNVMIDVQNIFDLPVKNYLITYDSVPKILTG